MRYFRRLIIALVIFSLGIAGYFKFMNYDGTIEKYKKELCYFRTNSRNNCVEALSAATSKDNHSILVLGSSELDASDNVAYPVSIFKNGNSDFNMVFLGRGYTQSLHHAINVAALAEGLGVNKVVLILSPQWFTKSHLQSKIYASRFSERMFLETMKNPLLSIETKRAIVNRVEPLLKADPIEQKRIMDFKKIYVDNRLNPFRIIKYRIYDKFMDIKQKNAVVNDLRKSHFPQCNSFSMKDFDKATLLKLAIEAGDKACTNNNYFIYNEYYDTYIRKRESNVKGKSVKDSYCVSKEYDDLNLFLKVCKEVKVEPLIISVPVNGRWYDWTGFPQKDREQYYQNIRDICKKNDATLADFSDREYEPYFLKDIMHMGWKGWVYLDDAIYQFYKKQ